MDIKAYEKRIEWFKEARFGMFIHWGIYAIPARNEWVRSLEKMTVEQYQKYYDAFDPTEYDPREWARLAKRAGMKYAILTAKHHDGFCLFDSALTDYKATNTKAGRDLIREYVEAFRAEGLRVGLYYSLLDWHHPDYPHYGDRIHPMRDNPEYEDKEHNFDNYLDYMHGQIRELCTNYGQIDILWLDFSYDNLANEAWRATELVSMIRELQPGILIDNRLENSPDRFGSSLLSGNPAPFSGDYISPEQIIPPEPITDVNGKPVCWEACVTLNNHWGYNDSDFEFKSAETIVRRLVECVSKGGNMLVNVGPNAKGSIPRESVEILEGVGEWMAGNSESIYGCGPSDLEKPQYGYITQKQNKAYLHVLENLIGPIPVKGIQKDNAALVQRLSSGAELASDGAWTTAYYSDLMFISYGANPSFTYQLPDPVDTVIKITLKE